ncbi:hypothetical protein CAPTEDRAFT_201791 [Capitella teleta]|uniref:Uncharacterized protein n=1 Tax=Capitella teleta TaxID=283909 RepID=R7U4P5_CAPTE|nr:hypothetical protein CAPTEDRAFT_201791 [Capitella teleta]|eukprot:ELU01081.1 hypothetical protein CAPTEDRAFT_201791 [Capitella teleta]
MRIDAAYLLLFRSQWSQLPSGLTLHTDYGYLELAVGKNRVIAVISRPNLTSTDNDRTGDAGTEYLFEPRTERKVRREHSSSDSDEEDADRECMCKCGQCKPMEYASKSCCCQEPDRDIDMWRTGSCDVDIPCVFLCLHEDQGNLPVPRILWF